MRPVPPREPARDDQSDEHADSEEKTVGWKLYEQQRHDNDCDEQAGRPFEPDNHEDILARAGFEEKGSREGVGLSVARAVYRCAT